MISCRILLMSYLCLNFMAGASFVSLNKINQLITKKVIYQCKPVLYYCCRRVLGCHALLGCMEEELVGT